MHPFFRFLPGVLTAALLAGGPVLGGQKERSAFAESFRDPEDGAFDGSAWLLSRHGFLPVPIVITEPAVGYGGGAALLFLKYAQPPPAPAAGTAAISRPGKFAPPSITAVAAGATENGTWFGALAQVGVWNENRTHYLGVLGRAHAVLAYHGSEGQYAEGFNYTSEVWALKQQVEQRLADSDWFLGAHYTYLAPETTFAIGGDPPPDIAPRELDSATAGLGAILAYDSRDNTFTPNRGIRAQLVFSAYDDALGGDFSYLRYDFFSAAYWPVHPRLVLGWRLEGHFTGGGRAPFYHLPQISLRGVPAARYQGRQSLVSEVELRWRMTPRWSLVGFGGDGRVASGEVDELDGADDVWGGGVGFRYLIARRLGIQAGADYAWSRHDSAFYLVVGSAWNR